MKEQILILDFGGQYTQLIARRVRECHVYSEVIPWNTPLSEILSRRPKGIILSGGPSSVHDEGAPRIDPAVYEAGIPILGICYGMQLTALLLGGRVEKAAQREYGRVTVRMKERQGLLGGLKSSSSCWMSHTWQVSACPPGFRVIAETDNCPVAAMVQDEKKICCVQFHPEVSHTEDGSMLIRKAFAEDRILPDEILWRQKAAFSDAVGHSMVNDLKAYAERTYTDKEFEEGAAKYDYCRPFTKESLLYRDLFEQYYPGQARMIPGFWMPNKSWPGCDVDDPSARVLANYGSSGE